MKNWKKIKAEHEPGVIFDRETMHDQIDYGIVVEREREAAAVRRRYRPSPISMESFRYREAFLGGLYDHLEEESGEPDREKWPRHTIP